MVDVNPQTESDLTALAASAAADFEPAAGVAGVESMETEALCIFAVGMIFDLMSVRRGAHWKLNPEESENLGRATSRVLDKYLPNLNTGPEAALVLAAVVIVMPRVMQDRAPVSEVPGGSQPGHVSPQP